MKENRLDSDEYFSFSDTGNEAIVEDHQIFTPTILGKDSTMRILVSWMPGSNEGFYVHVNEITREGKIYTRAIGKYWDKDAAAMASNMITMFIYK